MKYFVFKTYLKETHVENYQRTFVSPTDTYLPEVEVEYQVIYDVQTKPHTVTLVSVKEILNHVEDHKSERFIPLSSLTQADMWELVKLATADAEARSEMVKEETQKLRESEA